MRANRLSRLGCNGIQEQKKVKLMIFDDGKEMD